MGDFGSQSPFGCGVVLDPRGPNKTEARFNRSQSPFGCGVVLDLRGRMQGVHAGTRVSIAFRLWSGFGPFEENAIKLAQRLVSIAFRLWSGFGRGLAGRHLRGDGWSQSPFGCGVVLDTDTTPHTVIAPNLGVSIAFRLWSGFGPRSRKRLPKASKRLNRLSAVEWFWTRSNTCAEMLWKSVVSIAFRLWSGFGRDRRG